MPTPSKFTAARVQAFLEAIRYGASIRTAAAEAGVGHATALRWIDRGRESAERGEDGRFAQFYEDFQNATASPRMRALRSVWNGVPDDPKLAFRVLQTLESGWAPPQPQAPPAQSGPLIVNLSLGGAPVPDWRSGTVIDATESPALGDGSGDDPDAGDAAAPAAP